MLTIPNHRKALVRAGRKREHSRERRMFLGEGGGQPEVRLGLAVKPLSLGIQEQSLAAQI